MTPWHHCQLCRFSYLNLPEEARPGLSLGNIAALLLSRPASLSPSDTLLLNHLLADPALSALTLTEYANRNADTGLVYYALRAEDGALHLIFRGSESRGSGAPSSVDWLDNFLAPFHGSIQYPEIAALASRLPPVQITFSGHSKGAHNALYALAVRPDDSARAVVFNGQGFAPDQLTRAQKRRLARQAEHYVTRNDPVGALLTHPERRVFVRGQAGVHPHSLDALVFDAAGQPRPALRSVLSLVLELSSRAALAHLHKLRKCCEAHCTNAVFMIQ